MRGERGVLHGTRWPLSLQGELFSGQRVLFAAAEGGGEVQRLGAVCGARGVSAARERHLHVRSGLLRRSWVMQEKGAVLTLFLGVQ